MSVNVSAKDIWDTALGELQLQINRTNFDTWLKDTEGLSYEGERFVVGVTSTFAVEYLEQRLASLINKTLTGLTGEELEVIFQIQQQEAPAIHKNTGKSSRHTSALTYHKNGSNGFNPKYTFDSFIVGSCNRLAEAAARAVAEKPGYTYNPLFIYGGVGLGKTHLLHAIGHALYKKLNVLYVSTEQFTNEFIKSIREGKTEEFRQKYRNVDVLLIDDIHFIGGKEQTQEGFFHTFNDLHNASRQIVITSDRPPKSINLLEDRLRSRFEWGLITDVQTPDLETRIAILQAKAEEDKVPVPPDVLQFISHRIHRSIRELEGSLNRIVAFSRHTDEPISIELAAKALDDSMETTPRRAPTIPAILAAVSRHFDVAQDALIDKRRDKQTVKARHVAIYLLREEAACSFNAIGKALGHRDHSSIIRGYDKIAGEIDSNNSLRRDVLEIRDRIYARSRTTDV